LSSEIEQHRPSWSRKRLCSLVGAGAGLAWLVLVFLEKNTVGWLV